MKTHWTENLPDLAEDMKAMLRTLKSLKAKRARLRNELDGNEDSIRHTESCLLHHARARYTATEIGEAMYPEYEDRPMSIEPSQIG